MLESVILTVDQAGFISIMKFLTTFAFQVVYADKLTAGTLFTSLNKNNTVFAIPGFSGQKLTV